MLEKLRSNWFVVLVVIVLIGFTGYFIYDGNKDNVSGRQADGKDVIASLGDEDITADALYEQGAPFDGSLLYNLYKNAVISQSVETTSQLEEEAKTMEKTIDSNVKNSSGEQYKAAVTAELAGYGYDSYDKLYDYCLNSVKEKAMNKAYVKDHFNELKEAVEKKNPRIVSQIIVNVTDPASLTEDEQNKLDSIDKALKAGTFADAATAFSDDAATAEKKGMSGYVDADNAAQGTTSVSSEAVSAALELEKGGISDWITVTNPQTQAVTMVKITVDETDLDAIMKNEDETVQDQLLYAVLNDNTGLSYTILENSAKKLKITFEDPDTEKKINDYVASRKGDGQDE